MKKLLLLLGYIVLLGIALFTYPTLVKRKRLAYVLVISRLTTISPKAQTINVDVQGFFLAQTFWVSFKASDKDIQRWLHDSPALINQKPVAFARQTLANNTASTDTPSWFRPTNTDSSICYQIPQTQHVDCGTVWINEKEGSVYIKVAHK